jgi:hypothetical protein
MPQAHHITPRRDPDCAKYEVGNGVCLCTGCHNDIRGREHDVRDRCLAIVALSARRQ